MKQNEKSSNAAKKMKFSMKGFFIFCAMKILALFQFAPMLKIFMLVMILDTM